MASMLDANIRIMLADTASLRTSGAIINLGSINGTGSDTAGIRIAGLDGTDVFAATGAENADLGITSLTDGHVNVVVARYGLRRDISDLATLTGFGGNDINPARLAASMVGEYEACFMDLVADAGEGASTDVGTSGADMSVDDFYDAVFQLEISNAPGPYYALLKPRQVADLQESLRAEGGALQYTAAAADMLQAKGQGFVGSLLGVEIFKSERGDASGGNVHGCMWGLGAFGYKTGTPVMPPGATVVSPNSEIVVEFQRNASTATTEVVGHAYLGLSVLEQGRLVGIVTDE